MVFDLKQLKEKYNLIFRGVIHIGAHYGYEFSTYENLEIKHKIFFEPAKNNFKILTQNIGNKATLINKALGNENKKIEMNIETANNGQSNSILNPKLHLFQYPEIEFNQKEEVDMVRLDDYLLDYLNYNFLNIDVQGYELEVLKGAKNILNSIDYIMTEINKDEVYENCAYIDDLKQFLKPYGFELVEENWVGGMWGDGFFIKSIKNYHALSRVNIMLT